MKKIKTTLFILIGMALLSTPAIADYARDIVPAPAGTQGVLYYYQHMSGNEKFLEGESVSKDFNLTTTLHMFRYVYFGEAAGIPFDLNLLIPTGSVSLDGAAVGGVEKANHQIGDPVFVTTWWPYADPDTRTYFATTFYVTPPMGEYDNDKMLNLGSNRWAFKGHLGLEKGLGNFNVSLYTYAEFYTDNTDYTIAGLTLKKDPFFGAETHIAYDVTQSFFCAFDYFYENGGETEAAGIDNTDKLDDHSAGFTLGYMIKPDLQLLINYLNKFQTENNVKTGTFGLRLGYFF